MMLCLGQGTRRSEFILQTNKKMSTIVGARTGGGVGGFIHLHHTVVADHYVSKAFRLWERIRRVQGLAGRAAEEDIRSMKLAVKGYSWG